METTSNTSITSKVNSFEDACQVSPPSKELSELFNYSGTDEEMILARNTAKRNYVAKVLKEGAKISFDDNSKKWFCWFVKTSSGFVFSFSGYDWALSNSVVGSRLSFPRKELAEHFGNIIPELHNSVLSHQ